MWLEAITPYLRGQSKLTPADATDGADASAPVTDPDDGAVF
jgi:hypothetical protein